MVPLLEDYVQALQYLAVLHVSSVTGWRHDEINAHSTSIALGVFPSCVLTFVELRKCGWDEQGVVLHHVYDKRGDLVRRLSSVVAYLTRDSGGAQACIGVHANPQWQNGHSRFSTIKAGSNPQDRLSHRFFVGFSFVHDPGINLRLALRVGDLRLLGCRGVPALS